MKKKYFAGTQQKKMSMIFLKKKIIILTLNYNFNEISIALWKKFT
jgi:hypothetical protein